MYNPIALDAATISFVDLKDGFLRGLFSGSMSDSWLNRLFRLFRKKPPIFMEPALFEQYNHAFMAESTFGFTGRQLLNYLYFRLLLSYAEFIPARFAEKVPIIGRVGHIAAFSFPIAGTECTSNGSGRTSGIARF